MSTQRLQRAGDHAAEETDEDDQAADRRAVAGPARHLLARAGVVEANGLIDIADGDLLQVGMESDRGE